MSSNFGGNYGAAGANNGTNCFTLFTNTKLSKNSSFVFDAGWQAIPETLVFNLVLFIFFLIIFIILRRLAWDRKNLINSKRTSKGWLQSIYGDRKFAKTSYGYHAHSSHVSPPSAQLSRDNSQQQIHNNNALTPYHLDYDLQINSLLNPSSSTTTATISGVTNNLNCHIAIDASTNQISSQLMGQLSCPFAPPSPSQIVNFDTSSPKFIRSYPHVENNFLSLPHGSSLLTPESQIAAKLQKNSSRNSPKNSNRNSPILDIKLNKSYPNSKSRSKETSVAVANGVTGTTFDSVNSPSTTTTTASRTNSPTSPTSSDRVETQNFKHGNNVEILDQPQNLQGQGESESQELPTQNHNVIDEDGHDVDGNVFDFTVFTSIPNNLQATFAGVGYRLRDVLLISDNDILKSRGTDALQYLLFQRYVIYFLTILSVFCMLVVLPVNLRGTEYGADQGYARTTMINLPENSPLHWVHVVGAALISLIGIFMMHRFSRVIKMDDEEITRRTLLIRRVPKKKRNKQLLAAYFSKHVPNCIIDGIQSVYNVRELTAMLDEMTNLIHAKCYCIEYFDLTNERLRIRPRCCGQIGFLCGCCDCCRTVDGIEYYSNQEEKLRQMIVSELESTLTHPTGQFFITFRTERMAQECFVHLRRQQEKIYSFCPFSNTFTQVSTWIVRLLRIQRNNDEMDISRWMVSYAPYPNDINWCDISVNLRMQWLRSSLVNILLFVLFVFISTPAVILNASDTIRLANLFEWLQYFLPEDLNSKKPEILATFILMIAASALPAIVTLACQSIAYINISAKNHAIMWKVYLFLLLMVIVLPSLGLVSLQPLLTSLVNKGDFQWNCLFPVKLGAFFVNYTVQYAFIGNIMELMRIPELLVYLWYIATARSQAEVNSASRYVVWDFAIGMRYPRFLLIFAMVVTYSLSCPIITVAGLLYMIIKHFIDRYNIYYVYNPSKINSKIHSTAIIFVHIALLMMQTQIFTVTLVRTGYSRMFGMALFVFLVSLLVFSGHFFFYLFRNINHLTYRATRKQPESRREYCNCSYLPPSLYNLTYNGTAVATNGNGNGNGSVNNALNSSYSNPNLNQNSAPSVDTLRNSKSTDCMQTSVSNNQNQGQNRANQVIVAHNHQQQHHNHKFANARSSPSSYSTCAKSVYYDRCNSEVIANSESDSGLSDDFGENNGIEIKIATDAKPGVPEHLNSGDQ